MPPSPRIVASATHPAAALARVTRRTRGRGSSSRGVAISSGAGGTGGGRRKDGGGGREEGGGGSGERGGGAWGGVSCVSTRGPCAADSKAGPWGKLAPSHPILHGRPSVRFAAGSSLVHCGKRAPQPAPEGARGDWRQGGAARGDERQRVRHPGPRRAMTVAGSHRRGRHHGSRPPPPYLRPRGRPHCYRHRQLDNDRDRHHPPPPHPTAEASAATAAAAKAATRTRRSFNAACVASRGRGSTRRSSALTPTTEMVAAGRRGTQWQHAHAAPRPHPYLTPLLRRRRLSDCSRALPAARLRRARGGVGDGPRSAPKGAPRAAGCSGEAPARARPPRPPRAASAAAAAGCLARSVRWIAKGRVPHG